MPIVSPSTAQWRQESTVGLLPEPLYVVGVGAGEYGLSTVEDADVRLLAYFDSSMAIEDDTA